MKIQMIATGFVLGIGAALITAQAISQDHGGAMPSQDDMQKMMQMWIESMTPGEQHKMMNSSIGEWETTTRMWMAGPDGPPTETHGTTHRKWVLGGRFVLEELDSQMMMPDMATGEMKATPWNGMGLFGYDKNRNMYVGCWADSMGTQLLTMKGTASPDGKTFTYYGEMDEPALGVYGRMVRYVTHVIDEDHSLFQIYDLHAGDDYKVVEVSYTRKK